MLLSERTLHRLLAKIEKQDDGCWRWVGATANGYGVTKVSESPVWVVHKILYEHYKGLVPKGRELDHTCRTKEDGHRWCCNPDHVEPVTPTENQARGLNGKLKTHCKNGHDYTEENVYLDQRGRRNCRICQGLKYEKNLKKAEAQRRAEGRPVAPAQRTHCPQGHEYTPENTYYLKNEAGRMCRECCRIRAREQYYKNLDRDREKHRQKASSHYYENHEAELEKRRQLRQTPEYREKHIAYMREYHQRKKDHNARL